MSQFNESAVKTMVAGTALGQFLRVKYGSGGTAGQMIVAGTGDACLGVTERSAIAQADPVPVRLRTAQGTRTMVASTAIAEGGIAYAGASGKVAATGTVVEGTALQAAAADGDQIEVLPV